MTLTQHKLLRWVLLVASMVLVVLAVDQIISLNGLKPFERWVFDLAGDYRKWFKQQNTRDLAVLLPLAFTGGLVASISPCILSLLPVNLSYIGTCEIVSRRDALGKAIAFVLGVVTVLSLLGIFSSLAGLILIRFQGYFQMAVGAVILVMGFSLAGLVHLPRWPRLLGQPADQPVARFAAQRPPALLRMVRTILTGPFGVGLTFALVSSPCTSPVMFAVLTAAAATGSQVKGALAMICYALGYTAIIFFASLFTGLAKQTRKLLVHSEAITRMASVALLIMGGFYLINGGRWVVAALLRPA
jgi:cytochrome c-type biogenesis protein